MTRAINRTDAECITAARVYMQKSGTRGKVAMGMVKAILDLCPSGAISGVSISASGPDMAKQSVTLDTATADNARAILRGLRLIEAGK